MKRFALFCALWLLAGNAEAQQALSYIQLSPTPNYLANGGPGFVQIDAGGHPFIAQAIPGSGTVTNAASLANNAMVVGDGGGAGIKTVGGSIGGSFTTAGALSFTGAASGATFALPAGGPFTFTYPLASQTLASLAGVETFTNKTYSGGVFGGTFSGNFTLSGIPTLSGLSVGAQVACLGLSATNQMVLLGAGCGSGGGGSGTVTNSANLVNNALVAGDGGTTGVKTITTGANVVTALGVSTGSAGAFGVTNLAQTWSAVQTINLNAGALPAAVGGTSFRIGGANATTNRLTMDAFGAVNSLLFQRADGTAASPTAIQSQDVIGSILAFGYGATGYSSGSRANMQFFADQNWTDAAQGAGVTFNTTLNGGTTALERFRIANDGGVTVHDVAGTAPTGGSKGPGTINVTAGYYVNGTILSGGVTFGADFLNSSGTINLAQRTGHACTTYSILSTDRYVETTSGACASPIVWTLPALSGVPDGTQITVHDTAHVVGAVNTLSVAPNGTDTIELANNASNSTLTGAGDGYTFKANTTASPKNWSIIANTVDKAYTCSAGTYASAKSTSGNTTCSSGTTTVASGTSALGTSAIVSAACATVVTTSATGTATTDVVTASFNGDPTAVTGYIPLTTGMLTIISYPTANNVNFKVCNNTSASITPGAITLNWRVVR
jgi:hypothetical protein